jgi:hypothetical protein
MGRATTVSQRLSDATALDKPNRGKLLGTARIRMARRTIVLAFVVSAFLGALFAVWADGRSGGARPDEGWEEVVIVVLGFVAVPGIALLTANVASGFARRAWSRLAVAVTGFVTGGVVGFFVYALFVAGAAGVLHD